MVRVIVSMMIRVRLRVMVRIMLKVMVKSVDGKDDDSVAVVEAPRKCFTWLLK